MLIIYCRVKQKQNNSNFCHFVTIVSKISKGFYCKKWNSTCTSSLFIYNLQIFWSNPNLKIFDFLNQINKRKTSKLRTFCAYG